MKHRCQGYRRAREGAGADADANGWRPCKREALAGDRFCRSHRDALDGAMLALITTEIFSHDKFHKFTGPEGAPEIARAAIGNEIGEEVPRKIRNENFGPASAENSRHGGGAAYRSFAPASGQRQRARTPAHTQENTSAPASARNPAGTAAAIPKWRRIEETRKNWRRAADKWPR